MKPIFLIGYMGSGKSTLGRALERHGLGRFIDLDTYIENRYHARVTDIFAQHGEEEFRRRERNMLHEVADFDDVIVACGGGTPCFFDNMEFMNAHGTTVLLDTPHHLLHSRLMRGRHKRPLIAGLDAEGLDAFIRKNLAARMPHYSKAAMRFSADRLDCEADIEQSADKFIKTISRLRGDTADL